MPGFQKKFTRQSKRPNKTQCKETKQISESDSDMIQILGLSDKKLK